MSYLKSGFIALGSLFVVMACAVQVTSEVTRFHRLGSPHGETISIVALDGTKKGSLEFATYARQVAGKLAAIGYTVVEPGDPADIVAKMDYSVGSAQTRIQRWSGNYVHYHFHRGWYYPYYFGGYWNEPEVYTYTVYSRNLDLIMTRNDGEVVFEGHVTSVGRQRTLNEVMPYMVTALFHNFPGESGVTKVVTIREDGEPEPY